MVYLSGTRPDGTSMCDNGAVHDYPGERWIAAMEHQEPDYLAHRLTGNVLPRRTALKRLAGGAIAGALILSGCVPGRNPPTPVATSTPSPVWTTTPAHTGNTPHGDMPTAGSADTTQDE